MKLSSMIIGLVVLALVTLALGKGMQSVGQMIETQSSIAATIE